MVIPPAPRAPKADTGHRLLAGKLPSAAGDLASEECSHVTGGTLIVDGG